MERSQTKVSSKTAKPTGQCCGKTNHVPDPVNVPFITNAGSDADQLLNDLNAAHSPVSFLELPDAPVISSSITISPHSIPIQEFPLRV
jgi:hypothetical protein